MDSLLVITGPPGAGKSTVADLLARQLRRSSLVRGDAFFDFLLVGAIAPWLPEAHTQNIAVTRAAAAATGELVRGGLGTIYDGVVGPWFLDEFLEASGLKRLGYVVLLPPIETCVQRVADRTGHGFSDETAARHLHHQFQSAAVEPRHLITEDSLSPVALATRILDEHQQGTYTIEAAGRQQSVVLTRVLGHPVLGREALEEADPDRCVRGSTRRSSVLRSHCGISPRQRAMVREADSVESTHDEESAIEPDTRFATHYHLPDRAPFLNLSDLAPEHAAVVMRDLVELRAAGRQHRPFGPIYFDMRRRAEARLRELFIARGGRPERTAPHYFVLGDSLWYRHLATDMREVRVPLTDLPHAATSITVADSFIATADEPTGDPELDRHHQRVYLLDELDDLLATTRIPDPEWTDDHAADWRTWPAATFIEIQLWTDEPIRHLLPAHGPTTRP